MLDMNATVTPTHEYRIGEPRTVVTIHSDGHITLAEGVTLDEASQAFWRAMEEGGPGTCERILKERKE